eukprot:TRINITY_DN4703_c0_g1::TRINITY_DN4703_c0_g1_i1::g.19539::m.19539 TRINITY_DN4703_c0_g1::TRINITY_DN4703_c0_g1_i1::g.19539  ORF type:complete len:326 (-),score=73.09,DUF1206/PF06724.6/0.065 TRINITY_DN4703_c0_g1_i1:1389-2366(-)
MDETLPLISTQHAKRTDNAKKYMVGAVLFGLVGVAAVVAVISTSGGSSSSSSSSNTSSETASVVAKASLVEPSSVEVSTTLSYGSVQSYGGVLNAMTAELLSDEIAGSRRAAGVSYSMCTMSSEYELCVSTSASSSAEIQTIGDEEVITMLDQHVRSASGRQALMEASARVGDKSDATLTISSTYKGYNFRYTASISNADALNSAAGSVKAARRSFEAYKADGSAQCSLRVSGSGGIGGAAAGRAVDVYSATETLRGANSSRQAHTFTFSDGSSSTQSTYRSGATTAEVASDAMQAISRLSSTSYSTTTMECEYCDMGAIMCVSA